MEKMRPPASIHEHALQRKGSPTPEAINKMLVRAKTQSTDEMTLDFPKEDVWMQFYLGLLVCGEAVAIGAEIEALGSKGSVNNHWIWAVLQSVFILIWIALFVLRLRRDGRSGFCNAWAILDVALTVLAMFDVWLLVPLGATDDTKLASFSLRRQLRILHLLRLLRLLSIVRFFEKLRRLSDGLLQSLRISGLVLVMIFLFLYSAGVYMTIIVGHTCDSDYDSWENCDQYFGTVYESMFTLFQVMTLDDWSVEIVRPILQKKSWLFVFFLLFLMVTSFGLLNIIVGSVVENTLNAANELKLQQQRDEENQLREDLEDIRKFFEMADQDGNGTVDMDEFKSIMHNRSFRAVMKKLALPIANPQWLFNVFDVEEKGCVSIQDFTRGLFKFREHPHPSDMHTAVMQIHGLATKMQHMEQMMHALLDHSGCQIPAQKNKGWGSNTQSFCMSGSQSRADSPDCPGTLSATMAAAAISGTSTPKEKERTPTGTPPRFNATPELQTWSVPAESQGSARTQSMSRQDSGSALRASTPQKKSPQGATSPVRRPRTPRTDLNAGSELDLKDSLSNQIMVYFRSQETKSTLFQNQLESIERSIASTFDQMQKVQTSLDHVILPFVGTGQPQVCSPIAGRDLTANVDQRRVEACSTVQVNVGFGLGMPPTTTLPASSSPNQVCSTDV